MAGIHSCDMLVEQRIDTETGAVIFGTQKELNELVNEQVFPTFFETPVFAAFQERFLWDDAAGTRVLELYARRFPDYPVTCRNLEQIVNDLLLIGDPTLNSSIVEEPTAPEPAQLRKARERAQLREEVLADLGEKGFGGISTVAIREKIRTRPEYSKMWEDLRTPVSQSEDLPAITAELQQFIDAYHSASASELKVSGGVRRIAGITYSLESFDRFLAQAVSHGKI
jgi:hypothetical protein